MHAGQAIAASFMEGYILCPKNYGGNGSNSDLRRSMESSSMMRWVMSKISRHLACSLAVIDSIFPAPSWRLKSNLITVHGLSLKVTFAGRRLKNDQIGSTGEPEWESGCLVIIEGELFYQDYVQRLNATHDKRSSLIR